MNILIYITFLEIALLLVYGFFLTKRTALVGSLSVVLLAVVLNGLQNTYVLFPIPGSTIEGSTIVGKSYMRAAVFSPELGVNYVVSVNDKVSIPRITQSQALVKIEAAGLNPSNYKFTPAVIPFLRYTKKFISGYDFSGTVVAVGSDPSCASFKKSDLVFGLSFAGSFAEYSNVECRGMARKPTTLSHKAAAALPVAFLTSLYAFDLSHTSYFGSLVAAKNLTRRGTMAFREQLSKELTSGKSVEKVLENYSESVKAFEENKNKKVVVIGGSGGCGMFALQLAKAFNFGEIISVNSKKNEEQVLSFGATRSVDYKNAEELQRFLSEFENQVDFVYDTVSSGEGPDPEYYKTFSKLLKKSNPNHKYVAINGRLLDILWGFSVKHLVQKGLDMVDDMLGFGDFSSYDNRVPDSDFDLFLLTPDRVLFERAVALFESGLLTSDILIDSEFKLDSNLNMWKAFDRMKSRRTVGKIVIVPT